MRATVPATLEHTLCNALVDTGTTRSCLSEEYYQQLLLPGLKPVHKVQVRTASGSSLCPTGTITCDFKLGKQPFSFEFIICRDLSRPCILGLDFLRKYKKGIGWIPTWKIPIGLTSASAGQVRKGLYVWTYVTNQTMYYNTFKKSYGSKC